MEMSESTLLFILFFALASSLAVDCLTDSWCPCRESGKDVTDGSKDKISPNECQKMKGFFFSEERDFKCECCLILKKYKDSCKPAKNSKVLVKCAEGLHCDQKFVCRAQENSHSIVMIVKHPESSQISHSFGRSFAQMLRDMMTCDCSTAQCNNEVTRMECEAQHGLFVDKLSVRNRCQCCDRCYIPRGHHQRCAHNQLKNVQYVCDSGLFCSPFTHMCIEKREIFGQFLRNVDKENKFKHLGVFEDEHNGQQSMFSGLVRKKREDEEEGKDATLQATRDGEEEDKPVKAPAPAAAPDAGEDGDKMVKEGHEEGGDEKHHDKKEEGHEGGEDEEKPTPTPTTKKPKKGGKTTKPTTKAPKARKAKDGKKDGKKGGKKS